jgi:Holliday junction resolvasome RuvABC endonuclease subunit
VAELIQEYKIDEIAIEDIQLQGKDIQNVKVYRALAEVRGVLEEYFTRNKIKY